MPEEQELHRRMDGYGSEEMAIPEAKLIQATGGGMAKDKTESHEPAQPGDFYIPILDEVIPRDLGFEFVVVDMIKTRTYWGTAEISDEPPQCASADAETYRSINGENCKECPYLDEAPWLLPAAERRTKCLINYNLLGFRVSDQLPLMIRTSGISTQAARNLLTSLRLNKALQGQYHKALIAVGSVKKTNPSGEAFAFTFRPKTILTDQNQITEFKEMSATLLGASANLNLLAEGEGDTSEPAPQIVETVETPIVETPEQEPLKQEEEPIDWEPSKKDPEPPKTEGKEPAPGMDLDF